jgi:hypothetical protein
MLEGKINLNNLEDREIKIRIRYLLEHEDLKVDYPLQYDITLRRLYRRFENGCDNKRYSRGSRKRH